MPYCGCGGGERKPEVPNEVISIALDTIVTLCTVAEAPWMVPSMLTLIGQTVDTDEFCTIVPPEPPLWTLAALAVPGLAQTVGVAWFWWLLWQSLCRCKADASAETITWLYEDEFVEFECGGGHCDAMASAGGGEWTVKYKRDDESSWTTRGVHTFATNLRVRYRYPSWSCPGGNCGVTGGNAFEIYIYDCAEHEESGGNLVYLIQALGGPRLNLQIEKSASCIPESPPTDPPVKPDGYTPPDEPVCTDAGDICATLQAMWDWLRIRLNHGPNPAVKLVSMFDISGDGDDAIVADIVRVYIHDIPVDAGADGTSPPAYPAYRGSPQFGWLALSSSQGYGPRQMLEWQTQELQQVPGDADHLTWHLRDGIVCTVSCYVRAG